jgi:hypothetical protein
MRELMKDAGGATLKIAKRRLNSLATIQSHSCMANDETQLQVLKSKYELAASLAEIDRKDKADQQAKKNQALMEKRAKAPDAVAKLVAKGGDVSKLTKLEIVAILLVSYNMHEKDNTHKQEYLVNLLQGCIQRQPGNLGRTIENGLNEAATPTAQSRKLPYHLVSPGMLDLLTCYDWVEPRGDVSLNGCHLPLAQVYHVPLTPVGFGSGTTH